MNKEETKNLTRTEKYRNLVSESDKTSKKETKTPIISIDEFKSLNETKELHDLGIDDISLEKTKSRKVLEEEQIKMYKQKKEAKKEIKKEPETKVKKKKRKLKKGSIFNIIITLCIIGAIGVFIYSSIDIYKWHEDNEQIKKITDEITEQVTVKDINPEDVTVAENEEPKENPYWDYIKMSMIDVNMEDLKATNSEAIGWIQVNGTNINYPFVQTDNNDYYLTHAFNKSYNNAGWVFLDYRNNANDLDRNTIIYAHGRWDKTMFGSLKNLLNTNWYNNLDNHVIKVYINGRSTLWQVFSVYHIPTTNDYIQVSFDSDESFKQFVDMLQQRSYYKFNTTVNATDKIITLSTCYNDDEKMVMHAKLIKYTN